MRNWCGRGRWQSLAQVRGSSSPTRNLVVGNIAALACSKEALNGPRWSAISAPQCRRLGRPGLLRDCGFARQPRFRRSLGGK
jgi:hypothetical protein